MYKNKEKQKEANRGANKRYRQKGITEGITERQGITQGITLVEKLVDPVWREKLSKIHKSLSDFNVDGNVRLGVSGPIFDVVGDLLGVTGAKKPGELLSITR